jgi:hypothetical protein
LYAQKLFRKAASVGVEVARRDLPPSDLIDERALGESLAALAAAGAAHGVDGESALAGWARRFRERFVRMEGLAAAEGRDISGADPAEVQRWWDAAAEAAPRS